MKLCWKGPRGHITVEEETIWLVLGDAPPRRLSPEELAGQEQAGAIQQDIGFGPWLEARAAARGARPQADRVPKRPHRERVLSVRGQGTIWIFGRTVRISVPGQPTWDGALNKLDAVPEATAAALGRLLEDARETARLLDGLPCFCGTGAQTTDQQGDLEILISEQDPDIPLDNRSTVARCRTCARCWTFEEAGDSHYSYHYSVEPFAAKATATTT